MQKSKNFPKAIAEYIITTNPQEMEGDGFVLLTEIFSESGFQTVTSKKFIGALFNSMSYL
jgi:hypothetical protein